MVLAVIKVTAKNVNKLFLSIIFKSSKRSPALRRSVIEYTSDVNRGASDKDYKMRASGAAT